MNGKPFTNREAKAIANMLLKVDDDFEMLDSFTVVGLVHHRITDKHSMRTIAVFDELARQPTPEEQIRFLLLGIYALLSPDAGVPLSEIEGWESE